MTSVLTPISARDYALSLLVNRISAFNAVRLGAAQSLVSSTYAKRINSVGLDADPARALKADLEAAVDFLTDTRARVETIRGNANALINYAWRGHTGDSNSWPALAASFDAVLNSLNRTADRASATPNLLGAQPQSTYSFQRTVAGAREIVPRTRLSSDYVIDDSGGMRWIREGTSTVFLTQVNPTTGAKTGARAPVTGGVRLDALAGDAVTFTVSPDTAGATQYTGTIARSGLLIADAWFYEGLATVAGRNRAIADVQSAINTVDLAIARLGAAITTAGYAGSRTDGLLAALSSKVDSLTTAQALALQEAEDEAGRQNAEALLAARASAGLRDRYLKFFEAAGPNRFTRALIDVLA